MSILEETSFEDLLKVRSKIGTKAFNKKVLGIEPVKRKPKEIDDLPQKKKNRPQEMSSKRPVAKFREVIPIKKKKFLDPRFDNLYGPLDEEKFKKNYEFIGDIKQKELATLKKQFKDETDPETRENMKFLITRMENQIRERGKVNARKEMEKNEKMKNIQRLKEGKSVHFMSKSEKKMSALVDQYEKLKNEGKLTKYLGKKRKKQIHKDRKHFQNNSTDD